MPVRLCDLWVKFVILTKSCYLKAIIMPDDVAFEKVKALEVLGADVERVRPASIVDKKQASMIVQFRNIATDESSFSCSMW